MDSKTEINTDDNNEQRPSYQNEVAKIIDDPTLTVADKKDRILEIIEDLEKKVVQDPLIEQFYNKRGFNQALERQIALNTRQGLSGVLFCLDIDDFKRFNDTLGHPDGDRLILLYAQQIMKNTRETDIWGRVGGDELEIYLVGSDIKNAQAVAERIRTSIIEAVKKQFPDLSWEQTVSIGLAAWSGETPNELHVKADKALYQAKEERNKVVVFQG